MGQIAEVKLNKFDGGIENDPRDPRENTCRVVSNFDILTNPRKVSPYHDSESGDSAASTSQKQNFCIALRTGTTYRLYGLGVKSGAATAEVLMKDLTTGGSNDLSDNGWATPANNQSSAGATDFNLFVYYKKTGLIYGARAGTHIWAFDPSSVAAWADTHQALTYTTIAQGLVHSKDDILYIPYDNKIAKNNNGSWTTAALTLPTHYVITSICEYGNYLAIAAAHVSGLGNSKVWLWDRDASLATLSESIDFGSGSLIILEEIDGELIGISQTGGTVNSIAGIPNASASFADRVTFRRYVGGGTSESIKEIIGGNNNTQLPITKQKINNRLFFMLLFTLNGAVREGVWSFGRSTGGGWALVHERTPNNNTALSSGTLKGFFCVQDFMFQSFVTSAAYTLTKTNDSASYTATSIYESKKFNLGDSSLKKKLLGVSVAFEALPAAGQVVIKYKIDAETSYTTIGTYSTDNAISGSSINIESSGANLPEFKEIEFRMESTGNAEITGLSFKAEVKESNLF